MYEYICRQKTQITTLRVYEIFVLIKVLSIVESPTVINMCVHPYINSFPDLLAICLQLLIWKFTNAFISKGYRAGRGRFGGADVFKSAPVENVVFLKFFYLEKCWGRRRWFVLPRKTIGLESNIYNSINVSLTLFKKQKSPWSRMITTQLNLT